MATEARDGKMGKYECIAVCVLFVSVAAVLCCIALSGCTTSLAFP